MASTDAIINLVVNGSSKLQKAYQTLDQVSATITQLNKTPINIGAADKQIGIVADAYRVLLKDAKKFYDEITVGSRKAVGSTKDLYSASKNLASTTAGLRQQAAAFNDLAANIGFADKQQSKYFRSFVQGAELARSKGIRAQMEEFKALSELYTQGVTPFGERFLPGTAPMGRNALQQLIAQGAKVPNTTAALEAYGNELERTIRLVEIGSDAFRALDEAIAENARKLQSAPMQGPQPQVLLGPATDLGSLKAFRQRESYQKRVNDELEKQSAIETRIAQANLFDFQKKELSLQLEEAATALAENRLTDAQRLSRELDRQRQSMERMNRAQKPQVFGALGTDFMPVTGELPSTVGPSGQRIRNLVPGSPAAKLEEARAARESTQAAVALARQKQKAIEDEAEQLRKGTQAATALGKQKLKALEDEARRLRQETADAVALAQQKMREEEKAIADAWRMRGGPALPPAVEEARQVQRRGGVYRTGEFSPIDAEKRRQAILKANTRLRLKLDEIEASGVNVEIQRATLRDQVNRAISKTFDLSIKNLGVEEDTLAVVSESIARIRQRNKILSEGAKGYPSSPVRGGVNMPGSPIFNETPFLERRFGRRGAAAVSEGLIGGAFPLLFGQGVGAAALGGIGGAAGGFAGGGLGFGLSLIGTALGTAFDQAVQGAQELGRALEKPVENFDQLAQQSFFSSKALEDTIKKTIEYGDSATASALIQEEAIKKLGVGGVQNLKVLGTESDRLNRAFAELGQQMQAVAAGPLASVIGFFANIAGQAAAAGRVRLLRANLDEQQAGQFNQEILQRLQQQGIQRGFFAPSAPTDAEIGMLLERGALQDIVDKWQAIEVQGKIKLDPKQKLESEINALQKQLEVLDLGKSLQDQVRSAVREQQDLDKQRADLVRSYEESIGDIRKRVEDEIRNKRFATLEKENQLLDAQGQIRLRQLEIANQAIVARAGVGQRPEVEQAAKEVAQLVAQFTEQQVSAEEEAARIKRDAALEVQKIDSDAAQFKANIEKEVSRLNIETARRVADINEQVRRRNEDTDARRFNIERDIAVLKLKLVQDELALATRNAGLPLEARQQAFDLYKEVDKRRKETEALSAPRGLRGVGAVGGGGVSTAGLERATADYRVAVENYVAAQLRLNELNVVKNAQEFALGVAEFANKTDAALVAIQARESDAEIERLRYIELINAGLTDTVAQKVIELETAKRVALAVYDTAIAQLESKIIAGQVTEEVDAQNRAYLDQIEILRKRKDALEGKFGEVDTATGRGTGAIGGAIESDRGKRIQDFIAQTKAELNDLEAVAVRVSQGIGDAVGNSIANGISGLIEGTTTAKEVFAGFLKDVGDILIKEGTRMIAMYMAIALAKQIAGLFGGGGNMGGSNYFDPKTGLGVAGPNFGLAKGGAFDKSGMYAFAKGGMFTNSVVSSPTLFQFADGGVTRTGLMGEAGPEAIMPLERGPDGKLGVAARFSENRQAMKSGGPGELASAFSENRQAMEGGSSGELASAFSENRDAINATATVERERMFERVISSGASSTEIKYSRVGSGDLPFVTEEDMLQASRIAAQEGARLGQQRTLAALKNNPAARRSVGI